MGRAKPWLPPTERCATARTKSPWGERTRTAARSAASRQPARALRARAPCGRSPLCGPANAQVVYAYQCPTQGGRWGWAFDSRRQSPRPPRQRHQQHPAPRVPASGAWPCRVLALLVPRLGASPLEGGAETAGASPAQTGQDSCGLDAAGLAPFATGGGAFASAAWPTPA